MGNKCAIVLGAAGQDGYYLSNILLGNGYDVFGIVKKGTEESRLEIEGVNYISDELSSDLIKSINPDEIYNLMGVTNVFNPWDSPEVIYDMNLITPIKILDLIKEVNPKIKYLQASSSLIFGETFEFPQTENTARNPIYHYGYAKHFADTIVNLYRDEFGLFACSAILYNHESPRRGNNFFLKKVIHTAVKISKGLEDTLVVGDLDSYRDIGYAMDYMGACYLMMQQETPDDYIIGSGNSIKMEELVNIVFNKLGLTIDNNLKIDDNLKRGVDLDKLVADNSKIKKLGWEPSHDINQIIDIMIEYEMNQYE